MWVKGFNGSSGGGGGNIEYHEDVLVKDIPKTYTVPFTPKKVLVGLKVSATWEYLFMLDTTVDGNVKGAYTTDGSNTWTGADSRFVCTIIGNTVTVGINSFNSSWSTKAASIVIIGDV